MTAILVKRPAYMMMLFLLPMWVCGQRGLQLVHSADQIRIYRPPLEEGFITYDAAMTVPDASVDEIRKVLQEFALHTEWMYRCLESRKLSETGNIIYLYQVSKSNWPFRHRDYVLKVEVLQNDTERYRLHFSSAPDHLPLYDSYVRIRSFTGEWDVARKGKDVEVKMFTSFRPEVKFPKTFFRTLSKRIPLQTFKNLRERLHYD